MVNAGNFIADALYGDEVSLQSIRLRQGLTQKDYEKKLEIFKKGVRQ